MIVNSYKVQEAIANLTEYVKTKDSEKEYLLSKGKLLLVSSIEPKWIITYFEPMPYAEGVENHFHEIKLSDLYEQSEIGKHSKLKVQNIYSVIELGNKYIENKSDILEGYLAYFLNLSDESEEIWQLNYECKTQNQSLFITLRVSFNTKDAIAEEIDFFELD